jgi:hypothetical protein
VPFLLLNQNQTKMKKKKCTDMSKEEKKLTNGHHFGPAVIIEAHSHSEVGVVKSEVSPGMESVLALPWFQAKPSSSDRAYPAFLPGAGVTCTLRVREQYLRVP